MRGLLPLDPRKDLGPWMKVSCNLGAPNMNPRISRKKIPVNSFSTYQNLVVRKEVSSKLVENLSNPSESTQMRIWMFTKI